MAASPFSVWGSLELHQTVQSGALAHFTKWHGTHAASVVCVLRVRNAFIHVLMLVPHCCVT